MPKTKKSDGPKKVKHEEDGDLVVVHAALLLLLLFGLLPHYLPQVMMPIKLPTIDTGLVGSTDFLWEGCRESKRCSRDTYPESYITQYTSIRR